MRAILFLNLITAGFGAEVTVSTEPGLKKILGGAAYSLMGFLKAIYIGRKRLSFKISPAVLNLFLFDLTQLVGLERIF